MRCFVAIGYIYWLTGTLLKLTSSLRTVLDKKLLWFANVLAYIVRGGGGGGGSSIIADLVAGMFVGLYSSSFQMH